jgi:hypothetical protein
MRDRSMIDPLDREIAQALAVDPSPEFAGRVRRRIAAEPARSASKIRWAVIAGVGLGAAAAVAIVVLSRDVRQPAPLVSRASDGIGTLPGDSTRMPPRLRRAERLAHGEPLLGRMALSERSESKGPTHPTRPTDPTHPTDVEAEVVVDGREASALRHVLDRINSGRMYITPFVITEGPIYIAPIDIKGVQP